jgi:outer membrane protein TolC
MKNNLTKIVFSIYFSSFFFGNSYGQTKSTYSLIEAQETAVTNSEKLKNLNFDLEIAKLKIIETRAIGLPQINMNGSFSNFLNLPVQVVSANFINPNAPDGETIAFRAGTDFSATGTLQVNQLLFNGSYIIGLQFSNFYKKLSETAIEKTKEDILFDVTQAYQTVSVAKSNVNFVDSLLIITADLINKQKNYLELGLMNQEDMYQLEFSSLNAQNSLNMAKIQYENSLALLKMTMGLNQNQTVEISDNLTYLLQRTAQLNTGSLTNNMNYVILSMQVTLNEYNLKNKKAANLPSLGAFFQQSYNAFRNEFNFFANEKWYPQTLWGIQMQIPIFSSGSRWSQTSQAKVEIEKSKNALSELNKALEMQQVQLSNNLKNSRQSLELQEKNIALAKKIYENALIKESIGNGTSILVTQKYNQLILAQAQYVGAMLDVFNSKLNLDKLYHSIGK